MEGAVEARSEENQMKKIIALLLSGLIVAGTLSAQAAAGGTAPANATQTATVTKVEGKLALVNGMIAIQSAGKTYYVGGLERLIGFIDGLKEGASVKVEGFARALPAAPEYIHLRLTKLTFNGKDYDLSQFGGKGMGRGGMMGGRGFDGGAGPTGPGNMGNGRMMGRGRD
jgi:hypothetical protein